MSADTVTPLEGEVIEGRAVVVAEETGIAGAGTFALAALSDAAFEDRLSAMVKHRQRVQRIQRALMTQDVHYGIIPGTDKPTLYQPGAEVLCDVYRLRARFAVTRTVGDGIATPHLSYITECFLHLGSLDGPVVAHASGTANSWEKRYRYRQGERVCPNCGKPTVIKGKAEYGGGWLCWPKKGGCNTKWKDGDRAIEGQEVGQLDNPDPFDLDVVLDAMATKRAFVHATRRGCAVSDLFTSDVEDLPENELAEPRRPAPRPAEPDNGLIGTVEVGKNDADFELRQTPDGYRLGFRLTSERGGIKVMATSPLAEELRTYHEQVIGARVTCWGRITDESFVKAGRTITYQVLTAERVRVPGLGDLPLPAPTEAPSVALFTADEDAAIDAALERVPA